jgi:hypothetical protein
MERDEESHFLYKEGRGVIVRPDNANFSYFSMLQGNWVRGVIHSKRTEVTHNLDVFPRGYYNNVYQTLEQLNIIFETRKGV